MKTAQVFRQLPEEKAAMQLVDIKDAVRMEWLSEREALDKIEETKQRLESEINTGWCGPNGFVMVNVDEFKRFLDVIRRDKSFEYRALATELLMEMALHINKEGEISLDAKGLAERTGKHVNNVYKALKYLRKIGALSNDNSPAYTLCVFMIPLPIAPPVSAGGLWPFTPAAHP